MVTWTKHSDDVFELLFVGDTSFGENYQARLALRGEESILDKYGYDYSLVQMKPMMTEVDFVVANLETPITNIETSPFESTKSYVHWTDILKAPETLISHNVGLVSLANNHSFDYGVPGYQQTIETLHQHQLPFIGAGENTQAALRPFIGEVVFGDKTFRFAIFSAFEISLSYQNRYKVYATENSPGLAALDVAAISKAVAAVKADDPTCYVILLPHWGGNYKWRSKAQSKIARELFLNGVDLIIGSGAHMIQEVEKVYDKWVVYNLGNFMFNSPGRYKKLNAPPYSFVAKFIVKRVEDRLVPSMELYPIVSDNKLTHYQPRFVNEKEFVSLSRQLAKKKTVLPQGKGNVFSFSLETVRWIGMVCRITHIKPLKTHIYKWMYRAILMDKLLHQHGYRLLAYAPAGVNPKKQTVQGYALEGQNFQSVTLPMPEINYDWHIGGTKNGKAFRYKDLWQWTVSKGMSLYPARGYLLLSKDKWISHKVISRFDASLLTTTACFGRTIAEVRAFLSLHPVVFLKPRFGSMGNDIIVIRKVEGNYHLNAYRNKQKTTETIASDAALMKVLLSHMTDEPYLIQQGIETPRFKEAAFDVRVIMVNDGNAWQAIDQVRSGKKGSDLSNSSQGGERYATEEVLESVYPAELAKQVIHNIRAKSAELSDYLNGLYVGELNECAFDFLLDDKGNIYIAEINSKPGLARLSGLYEQFLQLDGKDFENYERYTLPHAKALSDFLMHQDQKTRSVKKLIWFDAIESPLILTEKEQRTLMMALFEAIQEHREVLYGLSEKCVNDRAPRIVFLSVSDGEEGAHVYYGAGEGVTRAIQEALQTMHANINVKTTVMWLKCDIVQNVTIVKNHRVRERLVVPREAEGVAFESHYQLAFLPEQSVAKTFVNRRGRLQMKNIAKAAPFFAKNVASLKEQENLNLYRFDTLSLFQSEHQYKPLYHGHALYNTMSKQEFYTAILTATYYLESVVQPDGRFIYSYSPKEDKIRDGYNILRHAGTVYAMLEVYELTQQASLLEKITLALNYLVQQAKAPKSDVVNHLCIVEAGYVKLGANALAILAMAKYMSLTEDYRYLDVAKPLANWIQYVQKPSGDFNVFKQAFETQEVEDFTSGYYPGEVIFALTRLYQIDADDAYLDVAERAALYLINERDKDATVKNVTHDHWLLYGLNELYRLRPNEAYIQHTLKICMSIINAQHVEVSPKDVYGGFYNPPQSTPTAIRAEGLSAAYHLLSNHGYKEEANAVLECIKRCVRFELQTQFDPASAMYLPAPRKALGGFRKHLTDYRIQIDYVQHNISAMLGLYRILGGE